MPSTLFIVQNGSVPTDPRVWPEATTMRDNGWEVTIACPRGRNRDTTPTEVVDGIRIVRFEPVEAGESALSYVREYALSFARLLALARRERRRSKFDVVHAANPPDVLLALVRGLRRRSVATIFDHHDLSPELFEAKFDRRGLPHLALRGAERVGFALADVVVSANDSFRSIALERGGKHADNVFVVRNGPDCSVFRPVDPDPEIRKDAEHVLGYAGLMGSQDGVDTAIHTLGDLGRRRRDWRAVFVGDGEARAPAEELARALGIGDLVEFMGFVSDKRRLVEILASCDVCLSPEPPSPLNDRSTLIKVAEYMAVGRPVVAFDLPETRFTAGESVEVSDDPTPAGLSRAAERLLDDPERRDEVGRLARRRAVERLSWQASEPQLLAAYERALTRSTRQ